MNRRSYETHTKHQLVYLNDERDSHITGMRTAVKFYTSVGLVPVSALATLAVTEGVCIYCHASLHQET